MSDTILSHYKSRLEAESAQAYLESVGIESHVVADDQDGTRPDLLFTAGGIRLVVPEELVQDARKALAEGAEEY